MRPSERLELRPDYRGRRCTTVLPTGRMCRDAATGWACVAHDPTSSETAHQLCLMRPACDVHQDLRRANEPIADRTVLTRKEKVWGTVAGTCSATHKGEKCVRPRVGHGRQHVTEHWAWPGKAVW